MRVCGGGRGPAVAADTGSHGLPIERCLRQGQARCRRLHGVPGRKRKFFEIFVRL